MLSLIKKVTILILLTASISGYCLLLKNQEYKVRKVILDNDYMSSDICCSLAHFFC